MYFRPTEKKLNGSKATNQQIASIDARQIIKCVVLGRFGNLLSADNKYEDQNLYPLFLSISGYIMGY